MAQLRHSFVMPDDDRLSEQSLHSVFSIEVTLNHQMPGGADEDEARLQYYARTFLVNPSLPKDPDAEAKQLAAAKRKRRKNVEDDQKKRNSGRNDGTRNSTGFTVVQNRNRLRILTCAHSIDECYAAGLHDLTVDDVNWFYHFDVTCSHQELNIHNQLGSKEISEQVRTKTQAWCIALDTEKDLMVLEVDPSDIYCGSTAEGGIMCTNPHPPIAVARTNPTKLERCILQGWPSQCIGSVEVGQLGFPSRTYPAITQINPKGYTMRLAEFTRLAAVGGCSGGPVINGNKECLGIYHGVIGDVKGYAISAIEVYEFLVNNGVLALGGNDVVEQDAVGV